MADYTPLISRAVTALTENTGEARRAVYDRARAALIAQLRGMDPPLAEEHITRERLSLEDAIRKVEADSTAETLDAMMERELAGIAAAVATVRTEPVSVDGARAVSDAAHEAEALGDAAANAKRAAQDQLVASDVPEQAPQRLEPTVEFGHGGTTEPAEAKTGASSLDDGPREPSLAPIRPRVSVLGADDEVEPGRKGRGGLIAAGLVLLILAAAGGVGWYFATQPARQQPQVAAQRPPVPVAPSPPAAEGERPKITDRVGGETPAPVAPRPAEPALAPVPVPEAAPPPVATPAPAEPPAAAPEPPVAAPAPPAATPAPDTAAAPPVQVPAPASPAPAASSSPTPAVPAPAAPAPAAPPSSLAVAQRAALFEETPGNQAGTLMQGSVVWRTQTVSVGRGQPPDLVLMGEVTIPERRMTVTLTIRRNLDETLPATHTIEVVFALPRDFQFGGVAEVPGVLMKPSEQARGVPLVGQAVRVTNGFFFIGLSAALDTDKASNIEALRSRAFIDIPMRYDSGRRAILTIEKGVAGDRAFEEALSAWGQ